MDNIALSIVGSFISIGLMINAFFLKGIFTDLNTVKVEIARLLSELSYKTSDIERNEKDIQILFKIIDTLKERLHTVEGANKQLLDYINSEER